MLLGRLRIRGKLTLLAAIPLLTVAALTVPLVIHQVKVADRAAATARAVRVAGGVGALIQDLQQERLLAAGYLVQVAGRSDLAEQTARVTDRITDIRDDLSGDLRGPVAAAVDGVRELDPLRAQVLDRTVAPEQAVAGFTAVISRLLTSLHLAERVDLAEPAGRQVAALDAVLRLDEGVNAGAAYLVVAAATRSQASIALLGSTIAATQASTERVQTYATSEQYALYLLVQDAFEARVGRTFLTSYPLDPIRTLSTLSPTTLFPSTLSFITLGRFVERRIATEVTAEVDSQQGRALTLAYGAGAVAFLVLVLVLGLSIAVAGSVARPLTRLTRSADRVARVAEEELERVVDDDAEAATPVQLAPVDVSAEDEIGDLARAFERVQRTAARLVERQVASRRNVAQMFGHVGRRTQNLVGRQIALIDQLEHDEQDPERLQYLYRLDHVSSRLRRNAGSLVVLSGATGAQPHLSPLQLGDAVRLALGEIEDYTRVDISVPDDLVVAPAVVGDLVLMLAELMENATAFSPPDTRVTVSADRSPTGAGAQLTIVDHGIGMLPERLAEENARLGRRERLDLAPTEVLGLFVVGRLARRHGLGVALSATPGGGVTATVDLARQLLVPVTVEADPSPFFAIEASAQSWHENRALPSLPAAPSLPSAPSLPALPPLPSLPAAPSVSAPPASVSSVLAPPAASFFTPSSRSAPSSFSTAGEGTAFSASTDTAASPTPEETPPAEAYPLPAAGAPQTWPVRPVTHDASPPPAGSGPGVRAELPYDVAVLDRASRTLRAGPTWNAFAAGERNARPATPTEDAVAAPPDPAPPSAVLAVPTDPAATLETATPQASAPPQTAGASDAAAPPERIPMPAPQEQPASPETTASQAERAGPREAEPDEPPESVLRQRVPGAQLPPGVSAPPATSTPLAHDADSARALIEQFEAGVRRALGEAADGSTLDRSTVDSAGGPATPATPALTRRVPGATLQSPTSSHRRLAPPPDPEQARKLIEDFESGVARALREIGPDHQHEEEEPK